MDRLEIPREGFIPSVVWVDDPATGGFRSLDRSVEPQLWQELVDTDQPVITQVDDGRTPPGEIGWQPTSSCSQPTLVADMLDAADVHKGHRVLEIGTGTGWNAAILAHRTGVAGHVVTVEIDPTVADTAKRALAQAGYAAHVVTGDGEQGCPDVTPYDRVLATASVRQVPRAWVEQTRVGGVVVLPWGTDYCNGALARLTVHKDGSASGPFSGNFAFMRLRGQRRDPMEPTQEHIARASVLHTRRTGAELGEMVDYTAAAWSIGLQVPNCYVTVEDIEDGRRHIELHDVGHQSWARVTMVRGEDPWTVHQLGSRRLWTEVEAAYAWWQEVGRPQPSDFELRISASGMQTTHLTAG